jgi:hypothetical protein
MSQSPGRDHTHTSLGRESLARFGEAMSAYREAFSQVQRILQTTDLGQIPNWVFAIDRLPLDEIQGMSEELLVAESRRRRARTALHGLVELMALENEADAKPDTGDQADLPKLDRFITVINAARGGGCIYVNGTFEPIGRDPLPDPNDTFDLPPAREKKASVE